MATASMTTCPSCIRNLFATSHSQRALLPVFNASTGLRKQQTRGKTSQATANTLPVRLLKDVETFGMQGSIVPVSTGQMRNEWFPRRIAEYITHVEIRKLKLKNTPVERNYAFGADRLKKTKKQIAAQAQVASEAEPAQAEKQAAPVQRVTPDRSIELIDIFVPAKINFFRQPIAEEKEPEPPQPKEDFKNDRQRSASSAADDLLASRSLAPKRKPGPQAIYGSVTTQDIVTVIRQILAPNEEAARVMLSEEDVIFMGLKAEDGETDRVKHMGEFPIEIMVKGASQGLRRVVKVNPQEE